MSKRSGFAAILLLLAILMVRPVKADASWVQNSIGTYTYYNNSANTIIVPLVLRFGYGVILPIPLLMLFIAIGEIISCYVLGEILLTLLARYRGRIFSNRSGEAK